MAAGNVISPKQLVDSVVVTECLAKIASAEDAMDGGSTENVSYSPPVRDHQRHLASMALIMLCAKLHHEHPAEFVAEVRTGLTFLLKNLILCLRDNGDHLPDDTIDDAMTSSGPMLPLPRRDHRRRYRLVRTAALSAIHCVLWLRSDRSFLQSSLLHAFGQQSFVFDAILAIFREVGQEQDEEEARQDVGDLQNAGHDGPATELSVSDNVTLALNVLTSLFKHSSLTKDVFHQLIGFPRLLACLKVRKLCM